MAGSRGEGEGGYVPKSHRLDAPPISKVEEAVAKWLSDRPAWHALRQLLPE